MDLKETYNKIAEDYFKEHSQNDWWVYGSDKFVSFLKPGSSVLDAGCGPGIEARRFIEKGMKITGIDFSEKMIEIAKKNAPSAKFLVMDIKDISSLEGTFDGVYAKAALLHISKKEVKDVLRGLLDKLKQGGYLYLAVKEKKPGMKEEEIKKEDGYGYEYKRFFSYFTMDEIKGHLKDFNMKICHEDIKPTGRARWIQAIGQKVADIANY